MRIILFFLIFLLNLNAYEVNILSVNNNIASINKYVKKGITGLVICPYETQKIICARAISFGKKVELKVYDNLKNNAFAIPTLYPKKGDKIIFAKDYNRVLIIAPNQVEYLKVKENYKNNAIISPDILASFVDEIPTKEEFINFAKEMDIGRYVFVLDKIYEVDANSFYVIKKYGKNRAKYKESFFTNYKKKDIKKNLISYYKNLLKEWDDR